MITFITKHSDLIGLGHLSRCLVLCDYFLKKNHLISFILNKPIPKTLTKKRKIDVFIEENEINIINRVKSFKDISIVILDGYSFNNEFEKKLKKIIPKLVIIDDNIKQIYDCNFLIDPNLGSELIDYKKRVSPDTQVLAGKNYSIISPKFFREKNKSNDILISVGGTDPKKLTLFIMKSLLPLSKKEKFKVILGSRKDYKFPLIRILSLFRKCKVYFEVSDIEELYINSKISIGSGGVSLLERVAIGLPSMIISVSTNQMNSSLKVSKNKAGIYLGSHKTVKKNTILRELSKILRNKYKFSMYEKNCKKLLNKSSLDLIYNTIKKSE